MRAVIYEYEDIFGAALGVETAPPELGPPGTGIIADSGQAVILPPQERLKLGRALAADQLAESLALLKADPGQAVSIEQAHATEIYNAALDAAIRRVKGEG